MKYITYKSYESLAAESQTNSRELIDQYSEKQIKKMLSKVSEAIRAANLVFAPNPSLTWPLELKVYLEKELELRKRDQKIKQIID